MEKPVWGRTKKIKCNNTNKQIEDVRACLRHLVKVYLLLTGVDIFYNIMEVVLCTPVCSVFTWYTELC